MKTTWIVFGNDTLRTLPKAYEGDEVDCEHCGGKHTLECGTSDGKKSDTLMFYKCGDKSFLGAVAGKRTV